MPKPEHKLRPRSGQETIRFLESIGFTVVPNKSGGHAKVKITLPDGTEKSILISNRLKNRELPAAMLRQIHSELIRVVGSSLPSRIADFFFTGYEQAAKSEIRENRQNKDIRTQPFAELRMRR